MRIKRNFMLLIALCLLFFCLPTAARAEETSDEEAAAFQYQEGDYTYTVHDGNAIVTKYTGSAEHVTVPATLGGYPVLRIGNGAFYDNHTVQTLTFSEGIRYFDSECVFNCSVLHTITYPSTAELVSFDSGNMMTGLSSVPVECPVLSKIVVPESNPYMVVYEGVLYTKNMAVLLLLPPADTRSVLTVPDGVIQIGSDACRDNPHLQEVILPDTVEIIGYWSFIHCTGLEKINIPKNCTFIGQYTFQNTALKSIHIPASLTTIASGAFGWNCRLETITVDPENPYYYAKDNVLYAQWTDATELIKYPAGSAATAFTVPSGVTAIGWYAFDSALNLEQVSIPASVRYLGNSAFNRCDNLRTVNLKNGLQEIDNSAFFDCYSLEKLEIPSSVRSIGGYLLANCEPDRIVFFGDAPTFTERTFQSCTTTIYYMADNPTWTADVMQNYGGNITWSAINLTDAVVPAKPYKIVNTVSGVHVYWDAVDGAAKYGIWRSETGKNGTYKWLANPSVPHFTDTTAESGKTYYYKVTAMNTIGMHTEKSEAIGITFVDTPDITSRENTSQGIKLGWQKISGATGYAIYRKVGTNDWKRVATIEGGSTLSWLDTAVKSGNGTTYKYTIRALYGTTLSGCRNTGRTMVRLFTPTISSAAAHATKDGTAFVRWNKNARASGYEVRFLLDGKVAKTFTVTNVNTVARSFEGLTEGKTYTVQVRSYFKTPSAGTYYSAWSTAKSVKI